MPPPVKRRYNNAGRQAAADHTRWAIIEAAKEMFLSDGYTRTTVEAIAVAAQVAPATVYKTFKSKAAILKEVGDTAVAGDHEPVAVADREWSTKLLTEPDAHRAVQQAVVGSAAILARITPIIQVVAAAAHAEPSLSQLVEAGDRGRRQDIAAFISALNRRRALRENLTTDTATDIAWSLLSPGTYADLVHRCRWTHDAYVAFISDQLAHALLDPRPPAKKRTRRSSPSKSTPGGR